MDDITFTMITDGGRLLFHCESLDMDFFVCSIKDGIAEIFVQYGICKTATLCATLLRDPYFKKFEEIKLRYPKISKDCIIEFPYNDASDDEIVQLLCKMHAGKN